MGSKFWGYVLILLGTGFLLDQMGLVESFGELLTSFWPLILVYIGWRASQKGRYWGAMLFVGVGLVLLASNLFGWSLWGILWPTVLIGAGVSMLRGKAPHKWSSGSGRDDAERVDEVVLFSGLEKELTSQQFRGGKVVCVFGGADLDMSKAKLAKKTVEFEVVCVFGGVEIKAPVDTKVEIEGLPLFGGWENRVGAEKKSAKLRTLKINGVVAFGGVEVR